SDFSLDGNALSVDWLHVLPYANSGSFTSRVFDGGTVGSWGAASWIATTPAGTSLSMFQRQGPTPAPDGSWSAFAAIPGSAALVGGSSRYIQYRADLSSATGLVTPVLDEVQFQCSSTVDATAPVISGVVATPGGSGTTAQVTWSTDELSSSSIDY